MMRYKALIALGLSLAFNMFSVTANALAVSNEAPEPKPATHPEEAAKAYKNIVKHGINTFARPRYVALLNATDTFQNTVRQACDTEAGASDQAVKTTFQELVIAWESIGLLRWGPASEDFRYGRMSFGADPAGFAWKKMVMALYKQDPDMLDLEKFRKRTTSIQGFTAAEYLIYEPLDIPALDAYTCELTHVIAQNMHITAQDLYDGWKQDSAYTHNLQTPDPEHPFVQNDLEAAMQFFKPLAGGISYIISTDFHIPLQNTAEKAKPTHIVYRRAGFAREGILAKLAAFEDLYRYAGFAEYIAPLDYALHQKIMHRFKNAQTELSTLDMPMETAVKDTAGRAVLAKTTAELDTLWHLLTYDMAEHFGFVIGFNLFDGD